MEVNFGSSESRERRRAESAKAKPSPASSPDFLQLPPVQKKPLFVHEDFQPWCEWVNCFLELTSNHRFSEDPEWGEICNVVEVKDSTNEMPV